MWLWRGLERAKKTRQIAPIARKRSVLFKTFSLLVSLSPCLRVSLSPLNRVAEIAGIGTRLNKLLLYYRLSNCCREHLRCPGLSPPKLARPLRHRNTEIKPGPPRSGESGAAPRLCPRRGVRPALTRSPDFQPPHEKGRYNNALARGACVAEWTPRRGRAKRRRGFSHRASVATKPASAPRSALSTQHSAPVTQSAAANSSTAWMSSGWR